MFGSNKFLKKDPLVEAVQAAMQDGDIRRQAEALVNEAFGVYSRKAVVNEQIIEYDAAIEEAYADLKKNNKDDKKEDKPKSDYSKMREKMVGKGKDLETTRKIVGEAKKLADKDYDKDGKIETPKDEVWGSRLRAAKLAGKLREEEQIDELKSDGILKRYHKKAVDKLHTGEETPEKRAKGRMMATRKRHGGIMGIPKAKVMGTNEEKQVDEVWEPITGHGKKGTSDRKRKAVQMALGRKHKGEEGWNPKTNQAHAALTMGRKLQKQGVTKEETDLDEAAYSAKAARAGKDIGKPGKMFSKIAKKAGERYGSEERGKKVAGAILKRIRAKHMKEENIQELSAFGKAFAAAKGQNFTFGGKEYSGARADQAKTASAPTTTASSSSTPLPPAKPEAFTLPRIDKAPSVPAAGMPNPKVDVPTPPVRPSMPSSPAMQNPDQERTKIMKESVEIGGNKYRIV